MQIGIESIPKDIIERVEFDCDRPRVYYGWHGREPVFIGTSYGGRTHFVEKNPENGYWESVVRWQADVGIVEKRDLVTSSALLNGIEMDNLSRYLPGGKEYSRLRLATKDDFNEELE